MSLPSYELASLENGKFTGAWTRCSQNTAYLLDCWGQLAAGHLEDGHHGVCGTGWEDLHMTLGIWRALQDATGKRWSSEAVVLPMCLGLSWNHIGVLLFGLDLGCFRYPGLWIHPWLCALLSFLLLSKSINVCLGQTIKRHQITLQLPTESLYRLKSMYEGHFR
jgi:hypothetical protein